MFRGTGTALVTPFISDKVDYEKFESFINFQIDSGVDSLIVLGTTGEAPSITSEERDEMISFAVRVVRGRVPVIVGTGSNSTSHTIELCQKAEKLGADGLLVVAPYYNKPVQEGLYRHFKAVAESVKTPIILYNVPGRTGCNISPDTVLRLAEIGNIAGVKEASGDMSQVDDIIRRVKTIRPDFKVYSGNDDQAFHLICSGGDGVISVLSNVAPSQMVSMVNAAIDGDMAGARKEHMKLFPLMKGLFVETNPIPVKYAVSRIGYSSQEIRLPLVPASESTRITVDHCMSDLDIK